MYILELPDVLLERVLLACDIRTIIGAGLACRALQKASNSDSLWLRICRQEFKDTDPTQWLSSNIIEPTVSQSSLKNYIAVYRLLCQWRPLIGLWRHAKAQAGLLVELYWDTDCIAGTQLLFEDMR